MTTENQPAWLQELENELRDPQNRPITPPLQPAFKNQLRRKLLTEHGRSIASNRWNIFAILRPGMAWAVLGIGVIAIWIMFSSQGGSPLSGGARQPTRTAVSPTVTAVQTATSVPLTTIDSGNGTIPTRTPPAPTDGEVVILQGYDVITSSITVGAPVTVTLYWEALTPLTTEWMVYLHLLEEGEIMAKVDERPSVPATTWQVNAAITDAHTLILPALPPPDGYVILVGLYDPAGGERYRHMINGVELETRIKRESGGN